MTLSYDEFREAVQVGDLETVELALQQHLNPNYREENGYSLLHRAVQEGHGDVVRALAAQGADLNITADGITVLSNAAGEGNIDMVTLLLDLGANVNAVGNGTALHTAVAYEQEEIVELLLARGADLHARDHEGRTPLFFAVMYSYLGLAERLVAAGALTTIQDDAGQRPIDMAKAELEQAMQTYKALARILGEQ